MKQSLTILFVCLLTSVALAVEEREGYCKPFVVPADSNVTIFTVPDGNNFVLLKLHASHESKGYEFGWSLNVDGNPLFDDYFNTIGTHPKGDTGLYQAIHQTMHDFPDRCVVVKCGETLKAVNLSGSHPLTITIIGYFYDATCVSPLVSDLNKDCKVNFADFALMAQEWLKDGHIGT
ncbi:MAG: hypothetical protein ACYSSP_10575 [Planctomycetota bacterium]|jgi:hypothetical protein